MFLGIKYIGMKVQTLPNLANSSKQKHGFSTAEKREIKFLEIDVFGGKKKINFQNSALFPYSDFFQPSVPACSVVK